MTDVGNGEILIEGASYYYSVIKSEGLYSDIVMLPKNMLEESRVEIKANNTAEIFIEVPLKVELQIMYDTVTNKIESIEIAHVSDSSYCEYCPYD